MALVKINIFYFFPEKNIYIYIYIYKQQNLLAKWLNIIYDIECKFISETAVLKRQCKQLGEVAQFLF